MAQTAVLNGLAALTGAVRDLIWPPVCVTCACPLPLGDGQAPQTHYCPKCLSTIEFMPPDLCPHCGRPFWSGPGHVCGDCLSAPPPFYLARSAVVYGGEAAHSLLKLKYHRAVEQAAALACLARTNIDDVLAETGPDVVIPMPLTAGRLARRGFNQAAELASALFAHTKIPVTGRFLARTHDGRKRLAALTPNERRAAIKGSFTATANEEVRGAKILLFDDILTTGATAGEAARALLKAGAAKVMLYTIARTVPDRWR